MKAIFWEHRNSKPYARHIPLAHAQILGERGGFYKVQIVDEFHENIILYEYKAKELDSVTQSAVQ